MSILNIIDCTIRDGGYQNNWDFDINFIDKYLSLVDKLPIDYVDLGYIRPERKEKTYSYLSPEDLLYSKNKLEKTKISVMMDAKDWSGKLDEISTCLESCLANIDLIRVSVNPLILDEHLPCVRQLLALGAPVSLNLMYLSSWDKVVYQNIKYTLEEFKAKFVSVYFVDSYGGCIPEDLTKLYTEFKDYQDSVQFAFHGHNNIELAFANSLRALNYGWWVDTTVTGIGRGAGNLKTELFLQLLKSDKKYNFSDDDLFDLCEHVANYFPKSNSKLQNYAYAISGIRSCPQDTVDNKIAQGYGLRDIF